MILFVDIVVQHVDSKSWNKM